MNPVSVVRRGSIESSASTVRDTSRAEFGAYIKTYRPDHPLARAAAASLRHFAPGIDVTLIPGDGYAHETLLGEQVLHSDDPLLVPLHGYFKKLWCFWGPYRRFLYVDSDVIAVSDLEPLLAHVRGLSEPFFVCSGSPALRDGLRASPPAERDRKYRTRIGDLELLREFDPEYDHEATYPFNSGVFLASRGGVPHALMRSAMERANAMHDARGLPRLGRSREGLFMGDQGLINYLVYKCGVDPVLWDGLYEWAGRDTALLRAASGGRLFVHWAGVARPSLLNRRGDFGRLWARFYTAHHKERGSTHALVAEVCRQAAREGVHALRRTVRRGLGR